MKIAADVWSWLRSNLTVTVRFGGERRRLGALAVGGLTWGLLPPGQGLLVLAFLSALVVGLAQQTIP